VLLEEKVRSRKKKLDDGKSIDFQIFRNVSLEQAFVKCERVTWQRKSQNQGFGGVVVERTVVSQGVLES